MAFKRKYGDRVQIGRYLGEDLGGGQELPEALISNTVLAELIRDHMRINKEYGDNPAFPSGAFDPTLSKFHLSSDVLDELERLPKATEKVQIPEDPEFDTVVEEARGLPIQGGPAPTSEKVKPEKPAEDPEKEAKQAERNFKKAKKAKEKEAKIREAVRKMLKKNEGLSSTQRQYIRKDRDDGGMLNHMADEDAVVEMIYRNAAVNKDIRDASKQRDKDLRGKDRLAKKVMAYYDDPEHFYETWYKEHPVIKKMRMPDGTIKRQEQFYNESDNPDPDLEGVDLVKYAEAMNEKFPPPGSNGFIEYDWGEEKKNGDPVTYEDLLSAAAKGANMDKYQPPEKLVFPEITKTDMPPTNNRLAMVRRMLFGELSDDELSYLMDLMNKDHQFSKGGFVDNKALKYLQRVYGPNHPVISDKRFKVKHLGKLAANIRRTI